MLNNKKLSKDNIIKASDGLALALSRLEKTEVKMLVVVDQGEKVIGCLTDGDIRRGLLNGFSLTSNVMDVAQKSPITVPFNAENEKILTVFSQNPAIDRVIELGEHDRPISLIERPSAELNLYLSPPHMGSEEVRYIERAFDENYLAPAGSNVIDFEAAMAALSSKNFALSTSSGTAAIHLALRCLGIEKGDRVYCSDTTFAGSIHPILYCGAEPVLIDSESSSWNMCPVALSEALEYDRKNRQLPKAIIVVHIYGQPAQMGILKSIADQHNIPIIEDCAESLGADYQNRPSGAIGLMSAFSFNGNKIITTSGGGSLTTDDEDLWKKGKKLAGQGRESFIHYEHCELGYNYRMSNVLAGIGLGQLKVLMNRVQKRREVFNLYREQLSNISGASFQNEAPNSQGNRWLSVLRTEPHSQTSPRKIFESLKLLGIESRPGWKPMHMQPLAQTWDFFSATKKSCFGRDLYFQTICLPSGSTLSKDQIDIVVNQITKTIR